MNNKKIFIAIIITIVIGLCIGSIFLIRLVSSWNKTETKETSAATIEETTKVETTKVVETTKAAATTKVEKTTVTESPVVPQTEGPVRTVTETPATVAPATTVVVTEAAPVYEAPAAVSGAGKYAGLYLTDQERLWLAQIVYHESNNQCFEGQQAVAEVVLNRIINPRFPNSVYEVLNAPNQFISTYALSYIAPNETNFAAVDSALLNGNILPADVVYFATTPLNGRVWGRIQGHVFCYI